MKKTVFGCLWLICSVVCGRFVRLFVVDLFGCLWLCAKNRMYRYFVGFDTTSELKEFCFPSKLNSV